MTTQTPSVDEILADPSTSHWLKDALERALERDVVDAAKDATILAKALNDRALLGNFPILGTTAEGMRIMRFLSPSQTIT